MSRKIISVIIVVMLVIAAEGCKKKATKQPTEGTQKAQAQTPVDYNAQAKKEINSENMQAELDKIEKEIEQERSGQL